MSERPRVRPPAPMATANNARAFTAADHRNGQHPGRDLSCWRCTVRAWMGRTPKPQLPQHPDLAESLYRIEATGTTGADAIDKLKDAFGA